MKKFFALLAVVLAVVSCQKDVDNLDVNVGGEQLVNITVGLPEETRAVSGTGFDLSTTNLEANDLELRYILEIYAKGNTTDCIRKEVFTTEKTVVFPVRLIHGRDYHVVAWADIVPAVDNRTAGVNYDHHYDTSKGLTAVEIISWNAMDETRDAFTKFADIENFSANRSLDLTLYRPFAKIRVVSTDIKDIEDLGFDLGRGEVTYRYDMHRKFNAYTGIASDAALKGHTFTYPTPYEDDSYEDNTYETETQRTLFADYIFVDDVKNPDVVQFTMNVWDSNDVLIKETQFMTDIPVHANKLTTIIGEVLTEGGNVKVTIDNNLAEQEPVTVVSSASHLLNVLNSGKEYILGNHIVVTTADLNEFKPIITRGNNENKTTIINLNGYTITVENNDAGKAVVLEDGNTLIFAGAGAIEGTGALVNNNNAIVVVTGGVTVADGTTTNKVYTSLEALKHVCENGGEFTFAENLSSSEILTITANNVVINGNGKTLTSTAGRAINVSGAEDVTIKNLNIVASGERAINVINNSKEVTIENVTATAANYTVNVAASAPGAVVAIKNSTLNGLCTVNVASAGTNVTVEGSTVNCNDNNTTAGESYAALCLNKEAVGGKIIATNSTINVAEGSDSVAGRNGAEDGVVTIDGSDERVVVMNAAITYPGSDYYHAFETIAAAVEFAKGENEISLIRNVELTEPLVIKEGQIATINLNGKTITGSHSKSVGAIIKNEGTLTIVGGTVSSTGANGGSAIQNNGQLIIDGTKIIGSSIRENEGWPSYPINNYGSSIIIKNATITGYQGAIACNTAGTVTLEDCTINKEYLNTSSHVFYINHEEAKVIVNGGTYTHNGMDGSLAYVNKGIITINGGTFNASNGGYGIAALTNGNVVINGGTFNNALLNWGGSISIKGGTFKAEPDASYLATGYKAIEKNGKYVVVPTDAEVVSTADELVAALAEGKGVFFLNDITIAATEGGYDKAGILQNKAQTINGNGHTLTVTGAGATWSCAIYTNGGLIKNLTVAGAMRGIFTAGTSADLYIENVTFKNVIYTFNSDGGNNNYGVYVSNSTLNGWTSHSDVHSEVVYTNCSFGEGSGYKFCRPYGKTSFVNCTFCAGYTIDESETTEITYTDCTFE